MRIKESDVGKGTFVVSFDKDEIRADGGKLVPFAGSAGTIRIGRGNKVIYNVWMPAASTPRGYKPAAKRMLETAAVLTFGRM